jgi:hypothetical protein
VKKKIRVKKVKKSEAEKILDSYKSLCLSKMEERAGYKLSLKDANKRVGKLKKVKEAVKFLFEVEKVINDQLLLDYFPYSQAFFYLRDMIVLKADEMKKIIEEDRLRKAL